MLRFMPPSLSFSGNKEPHSSSSISLAPILSLSLFRSSARSLPGQYFADYSAPSSVGRFNLSERVENPVMLAKIRPGDEGDEDEEDEGAAEGGPDGQEGRSNRIIK